MTTTLALLGVVTAMLAVQGLIILAHSLQNRMGTMPLGVITGACMFSVWMYAEVAPVLHITENITIHLLAIIVYTNLLSALLMAYICDGTNYARRLLGLLLVTVLLALLVKGIIHLSYRIDTITAVNPLPERYFAQSWQINIASIISFLVAFILVTSLFQFITNRYPDLPQGMRIAIVLALVFLVDGLMTSAIVFAGQPQFVQHFSSQVISKVIAAFILAPVSSFYLARTLKSHVLRTSEERPVFDLVGRVTEMDRELQTLLSTMIDGLILYTNQGKIIRVNTSAERITGQSFADKNIDDPVLKMTYPDGTLFPRKETPLVRTLKSQKPVENVEVGIRKKDGSECIISVNASPLIDSKGRVRGGLATFRDITQQKQVDDALASSQDFLKRLIDQAPIGIGVFDSEGLAEHLNRRFIEYLGKKNQNELLGQFNIFDDPFFMNKEILRQVVQAYKGRIGEIEPKCIDITTREIFEFDEYPDADKAGTKIISHTLFPIHDKFGKVHSVVVLVNDLTENYEAEHIRSKIETRYQHVVSRISDYIFSAVVHYDSLQYEFCTNAVEKITGYPEEFFLNDNWFWFTIIHPDDKKHVQNDLLKVLSKGGNEGVIQYRIRSRREGIRWVLCHFTALRDEKDKVERVIGVVSDITTLKETERALQKTVRRFRSLVNNMHELLFTTNLQGQITFANQAFNRLTGISERAVLGKSFFECFHEDDTAVMKKQFLSMTDTTDAIRSVELRLKKNDHNYLTLIVNADPIYDESEGLTGIIVVGFDITDKKIK